MCRVGGDEQDGLAHAGELDGEGTGGGGFADAAFAADEDPAEGFLLEDGVEGRFEGFWVIVRGEVGGCCRHCGGGLEGEGLIDDWVGFVDRVGSGSAICR